MIKKIRYTYKGMNQDVNKEKYPFTFYYEGNNIRMSTTDSESMGAISNEKGNQLSISIPAPKIDTASKIIYTGLLEDPNILSTYTTDEINQQVTDGYLPEESGTQQIIGYGLTRNSIILFTTDSSGFDCIWRVDELMEGNFTLILLYVRNMNLTVNNPIQCLFNYENEKIQKVYWVDGLNQLRFLNTVHSISNGNDVELIDVNLNTINIVGEFEVSQPIIDEISSGGIHTSGMIQYAYNLYRLNGSQTIISPLSELVSLDKGPNGGGGELNEILGASPVVTISNLDTQYSHIKVYAIKYTSYNQEPSISLIADTEIDDYNNFTYFDDGNAIEDISAAEFLFLGSNPFIPKHIQSKDNRLFSANVQEKPFIFNVDMRAYSFNSSGVAKIHDGTGSFLNVTGADYGLVPTKYDATNKDYNTYKYQANGVTIGGEGQFIKFAIVQKSESQLSDSLKYSRFFKDKEIYRLGLVFFNNSGQASSPKWMNDFVAPSGNLEGKYNTLLVEIKEAELTAYINSLNLKEDERPIGYKIVRADRTLIDRTIICQGLTSGMMCQTTKDVEAWKSWQGPSGTSGYNKRRDESKNVIKMPIPVSRGFSDNVNPLYGTEHLVMMNMGRNVYSGDDDKDISKTEIYHDAKDSYKRQQSWQYTKLMQLYSPEILFNTGVSFGNGLEMSVKGLAKRTETSTWGKLFNINSLEVSDEGYQTDTNNVCIAGGNANGLGYISNWGFICPTRNEGGDTSNTLFQQFSNKYNTFIPTVNNAVYPIYGSPEVSDRGQGSTSYNKDSAFKYNNSLVNLTTDKREWEGRNSKDDVAIRSTNSFGCRSVMMVEGAQGTAETGRKSLDQIHAASGIAEDDGMLMIEIKRPEAYLYEGNIYGGNSYEAKSRATYIEIGVYSKLSVTSLTIDSPGDTYVQKFQFARLSKTDTIIFKLDTIQLTDIVEFNVETTVNLENRNDISLANWDNEFQPKYNDMHEYNRVYSQVPNLITRQSDLFKINQVNNFDTRIISSKLKLPGEFIDNWTDFLENETMDLDGKYGPINGLVNSNDNIYTLQDTAISKISISPNVQIQGGDIEIELGTGKILYSNNYVTTTSGTINKWSVFNSNTGFYYYDAYNKSFNFITGNKVIDISTVKGMHSFFQNNSEFEQIRVDNPLIKSGVTGIFDPIDDVAYLTIHQGNKSFTITFNEKFQTFESFYDFKPSIYINKGFKLLSTDTGLSNLYTHKEGSYNTFYGVNYPSSITLQLRPEANDAIFNNIVYKSQVSVNGIDVPKQTLTGIRSWNEYQDSTLKSLIVDKNISRNFRMWKANIPREILNGQPTLNRIRGQWAKLYLEFDNNSNYKLLLHDMTVTYTAYPN